MIKARYDTVSRKYIRMTFLGIMVLVFLLIVSIVGAAHDSDVLDDKGDALYNLNQFNEAIKAYDKAIEINPQNSDAWNYKGLALGKLNNHEDAMKAYDKASEIAQQKSTA